MTLAELIALRDDTIAAIADLTSGRHMAVPKGFAIRSDALRQSAKGQDCTLRLPGVCSHDPSTVVLCHLPGSQRTSPKGTGAKGHDTHAVYGCRACHDYIDWRDRHKGTRTAGMLSNTILLDAMLRALDETHYRMVDAGLISVKGFPNG